MEGNTILSNYDDLDIGTNILIRFIDGTILKGVVRGFTQDIISIKRASIFFPRRRTRFRVTTVNVNINTFDFLIHSVSQKFKSP